MFKGIQHESFISIYDIFENQVKYAPENIAIISDNQVTYQQLQTIIQNIELKILSTLNIEHIDVAAIVMQPSIDFVATMFALLKLGITYIPIDSSYPVSYQRKVISDTNASVVFINCDDENFHNSININKKDRPVVLGKENFRKKYNDIAYIINTSGTTGGNKSVMIRTDGLVNLFRSCKGIFHITARDIVPLFHSIAFDFSIWEIFIALLNGACLKIVPNKIRRDPSAYAEYIHREKVTILNITPTYFYQLEKYIIKNKAKDVKLKLILFGGERLSPENLKCWFQNKLSKKIDSYNMYGITEGTIHSTYKKIDQEFINSSESNIGYPLPGVLLAIVDDKDNAIINNSIGELCISGESVTAGYLNEDKFQTTYMIYKDLDGTGERFWFKTGDLVSRNKFFEFIYHGRKGGYLKINGVRVNLENIEKYILEDSNISNAVVMIEKPNNSDRDFIVAYIQSEILSGDNECSVLENLKNKLPMHMVPNQLFFVKNFPKNINGKLDTKEIRRLAKKNFRTKKYDREDIEQGIRRIWADILNNGQLQSNQNFFDVGGTSLNLLTLFAKVSTYFNVDIQLIDLIKNSTIMKQAKFIYELE